jgi:hypothetical protein
VRYFTLKDILDKPENDPAVKKARKAIMTSGIVPRMLEKQNSDGSWGVPENFYVNAKYNGTVWNIITLAELGADGKDKRIKKAAEFILARSQDKQSGGFAYRSSNDGGDHEKVIPCLTGNMEFSLIRFGYLNNPLVQQGIEQIAKYQRFDDGIEQAPQGWPYTRFKNCWGKHTCHMGAVKALKALAEIPVDKRNEAVNETIKKGAEYLLMHRLYKSSRDPAVVAKRFWVNFGFPTLWKIDALEMLDVMVKLGYRDARLQDAIDLVISRQDEQGCWKMEKSWNSRLLVSLEKDNKPSKWITLQALKALKGINSKKSNFQYSLIKINPSVYLPSCLRDTFPSSSTFGCACSCKPFS